MTAILESMIGSILAATILAIGAVVLVFIIDFKKWIRIFRMTLRMIKSGFINFYCSRNEYITSRAEKSLEEYIENAEKSFVYIGFYFSSATEKSKLDASLEKLLEKNCTLEIVLMDEDISDEILHNLEIYFGIGHDTLKQRLKTAYEHLNNFRNNLSRNHKDIFIIKRHRIMITSSAMIIDEGEKNEKMLVDSKIFDAGHDSTFGMEFCHSESANTLYQRFSAAFRKIRAEAE